MFYFKEKSLCLQNSAMAPEVNIQNLKIVLKKESFIDIICVILGGNDVIKKLLYRGFTVVITYLSLVTGSFSYSEDYLAGYVSAVVDELLPEEEIKYTVKEKHLNLIIMGKELDRQTQEKLVNRLESSPHFSKVNITYSAEESISRSQNSYHSPRVNTSKATTKLETLPSGVIYDSPIADPKWPKFSVGYQKHFHNTYGKHIFKLSFGENLVLLRYRTPKLTYELGIQAGLFGLMNFSSSPSKLVNSDYFVGLGFSVVYDKNWQNLFQFSHLSAHLGDELLVSNPSYLKKRVNLSYEAIKWYTAYRFNSLRPYLGFGYLIDRDPSSMKPFTLEAGLDYISATKILWDKAHYVFGIHSFFWNETRFKPSINISTGIQLDNPVWKGRYIRFLLDFSHGNSRHGQFYKKKESYVGFGISISS